MFEAKPTLLEPMAELEITMPSSRLGGITSDLSSKRGPVVSTDFLSGDQVLIVAAVPLSEVGLYPSQLKPMTDGSGSHALEPAGHEPVPSHLREQLVNGYRPDLNDDLTRVNSASGTPVVPRDDG